MHYTGYYFDNSTHHIGGCLQTKSKMQNIDLLTKFFILGYCTFKDGVLWNQALLLRCSL